MNSIFLGITFDNWLTICLIGVGLSAFGIYKLQERKKINEAASLIILQIEELQNRIKEISTFIVDGLLNETNFYESLPLMDTNYWNTYKHYFVRKMDADSYSALNLFYQYIAEIQEQQLLMKEFQKNFFFHTQNTIATIETQLISAEILPNSPNTKSNISSILEKLLPKEISFSEEEKNIIKLIGEQISLPHVNNEQFWKNFQQQKDKLTYIINQKALTAYIPLQIRVSLEKMLKKYSMLEVKGTEGYKTLRKYSKRKF